MILVVYAIACVVSIFLLHLECIEIAVFIDDNDYKPMCYVMNHYVVWKCMTGSLVYIKITHW